MKSDLDQTPISTEKPINVYEFSLFRSLRGFVILFLLSASFIVWWIDISEPQVFLIPVVFIAVFVGSSVLYAWIKREHTNIKIYQSGISVHDEFTSWYEIDDVRYCYTDIDSRTYTLIVSKKDASKITCDLNFLNEKHEVIYETAKTAFEMYTNND